MTTKQENLSGGLLEALVAQGRSYLNEENKVCITDNEGIEIITNENNGMTLNATTLRQDEWIRFDEKIVETTIEPRDWLDYVNANGMTEVLPDALGTMEIEYETVSDTTGAMTSMDGAGKTQDSDIEYKQEFVPVPYTHADWELDLRRLSASRKKGSPLDTTMAVKKTRNVMAEVESNALVGNFPYGQGTMYGLLTFPYVISDTGKEAWTKTGKTGAQILADVKAYITLLNAQEYFGKFTMFLNNAYSLHIDDDYSTLYPNVTIRDRILKNSAIEAIVTIGGFPANTLVVMRKDKEAYSLVKGMPVTMYETGTQHGFRRQYRIGTIQFPMMKHDYEDKTPILKSVLTP